MRPARVLGWAIVAITAALIAILPAGPWLIREQPLERPDAILVLGSHEAERLPHAARLAHQWPDAQVLLTQPVNPTEFNCQDCPQRVRTLQRAGVASRRVHVLAPPVRSTFDEMQVAAGWVSATGRRRLLVVTSPYHTRRALGLAAAVLPEARVGVSACAVAGGLARPWWSRRYDRRYVVYEMAALVNNSWRHGLSPGVWLVRPTAPRV